MTNYLVTAFAWSATGFIAGYFTCKLRSLQRKGRT